ncbi:hypothetical protein DPMN_027215 [Dreissena polymorpha]|uniref:Uncharacterized protein n=1 Tax=Dreissena polymorpha TaxID=45954 RepID=A0A9D4LUS8_DREPO|nr:hypothetical protein DPMN_027215 [Dreissena polymorpha]
MRAGWLAGGLAGWRAGGTSFLVWSCVVVGGNPRRKLHLSGMMTTNQTQVRRGCYPGRLGDLENTPTLGIEPSNSRSLDGHHIHCKYCSHVPLQHSQSEHTLNSLHAPQSHPVQQEKHSDSRLCSTSDHDRARFELKQNGDKLWQIIGRTGSNNSAQNRSRSRNNSN